MGLSYGFGLGPSLHRQKAGTAGTPSPNTRLMPGAGWDTTPGSGFSVIPEDPVRSTAKPAIALITRPRQFFAGSMRVDVLAFALDANTMTGGIDRVRFYFEGATRDVVAPEMRRFTRFDGSAYWLPCYSVDLEKPADLSGEALLYIKAIPSDASMQSRVIGPFTVFPHDVFPATGSLHDIELTVDHTLAESAGVNYQSFTAAHSYLQAQHAGGTSFKNPLITMKRAAPSGYWDITQGNNTPYAPAGWLTVKADVPVIFGKVGPLDSIDAIYQGNGSNGFGARPKLDGVLMQGSNITLDAANMAIYTEFQALGKGWAFEGCRIQNSYGAQWPLAKGPRQLGFALGQNYFIDCLIDGIANLFNGCALARGNITEDTIADYASNAAVMAGNMANTHTSGVWNEERNAMTVQYSGAGTGTIALGNTRDNTPRVLEAKVNGSVVGTLTLNKSNGFIDPSKPETVQQVVDFFNGLSGWAATLISNDRRATQLGLPGVLHGFTDTDAKTAPLTLVCRADLHGDYYQFQEDFAPSPPPLENVVIYGNVANDFAAQKLFFSMGSRPANDVFAVNNAFGDRLVGFGEGGSEDGAVLLSQLGRSVHSHVVIAHNSMDQKMSMRHDLAGYNPDTRCLIANNVLGGLSHSGVRDLDIVLSNNHTFIGTSAPAGASGHSTGGGNFTLFGDRAAGDFTPAGQLLENLKPPVFPVDINGTSFGPLAPAGAGAAVLIDFQSLPAKSEPTAVAPIIIGSSITGDPQDGEVLVAAFSATGIPVPLAAFQWQRNGTNLDGATQSTLALNAQDDGWQSGDVVSCVITATNTAGEATAEPRLTFVAPVPTNFNNLVSSSATMAAYQWTDRNAITKRGGGAPVQGSGHFIQTVDNGTGNASFNQFQSVQSRQPVFDQGALYNETFKNLRIVFGANNGPINATLVFVVKTTDSPFLLMGTNHGGWYAGAGEDGVTSPPHGNLAPTYHVDGAALASPNRNVVHDAIATGAPKVVRISGLNLRSASVAELLVSSYNTGSFGLNLTGRSMLVAILDGADANYASALADAEIYANEVISGLSL